MSTIHDDTNDEHESDDTNHVINTDNVNLDLKKTDYTPVNNNEFDIASIIPAKGDPRRPPEWFTRALLYVGIAVIIFMFTLNTWNKVNWIITDILISLFIALAMEPIVNKLDGIRILHRITIRRTDASIITWVSVLIITGIMLTLFGSMFIEQMTGLIKSIPDTYESMRTFLIQKFNLTTIPAFNDLGMNIIHNMQSSWLQTLTDKALGTVIGFGNALLSLMIIVIVTYYISAYSNNVRRNVCKLIRPAGQKRFLKAWEIIQNQISSFLYSRIILAIINAVCLAIFMILLKIPYWLPLSLFCGLVSQFIPTVGTYIGGALPVLSAFGSNGIKYAVFILIYIIVYQQIENLILSPWISQKTMDLNPAIALLAVFFFGAIMGPLGAFIALPLTASIKVVFEMYITHHDVVDSELVKQDTVKTVVLENK